MASSLPTQPPALCAGDAVAVVSPAGPVTPELLADGLAVLKAWGLRVQLDQAVYARGDPGYLAGSDQKRLMGVQRALADPHVKAVVFSRGGYGTMRLLPALDLGALRRQPKILCGFSDLTALHLHVAQHTDIPTLHGPVVKSLGGHQNDPSDSLGHLRAALFGRRRAPLTFSGLTGVCAGRARGRLLGGNLSIVAAMVGSRYCADLSDAILLLEDVGEADYRLDRHFATLRLALDGGAPAGVVLGDFTDCGGVYVADDDIQTFVGDLAAEFGCPVVAGFPAGHGRQNVAVPMGVEATMDAAAGKLVVDADAVASSP